MGLVMPDFGLLFWMVVSFSLLLIILKRYAWGPITRALNERDSSISKALNAAEKARQEMDQLRQRNDNLMKEAILERERIVREAREIKESIVREAREEAIVEAQKIMEAAKVSIEQERALATAEMKKMVASYSVEIAELLLRQHLTDNARQKELINSYIEKITVN